LHSASIILKAMHYTHHEGANNNIGHLGELVMQEGCGCMISDLREQKDH